MKSILLIVFGLVKVIYTNPDPQPTFQYIAPLVVKGAAAVAGLATGFSPYSGGLGGGFARSPYYGGSPYIGGPEPYYGGGNPYYGGSQYYAGGSPYYSGGSPYYSGGSPYYGGGSPYYNGGVRPYY